MELLSCCILVLVVSRALLGCQFTFGRPRDLQQLDFFHGPERLICIGSKPLLLDGAGVLVCAGMLQVLQLLVLLLLLRGGGGFELLHVPMPRGLKPRPSTSPTRSFWVQHVTMSVSSYSSSGVLPRPDSCSSMRRACAILFMLVTSCLTAPADGIYMVPLHLSRSLATPVCR